MRVVFPPTKCTIEKPAFLDSAKRYSRKSCRTGLKISENLLILSVSYPIKFGRIWIRIGNGSQWGQCPTHQIHYWKTRFLSFLRFSAPSDNFYGSSVYAKPGKAGFSIVDLVGGNTALTVDHYQFWSKLSQIFWGYSQMAWASFLRFSATSPNSYGSCV